MRGVVYWCQGKRNKAIGGEGESECKGAREDSHFGFVQESSRFGLPWLNFKWEGERAEKRSER